MFAHETVEVALPNFGKLGVTRFFVVAGPAGEESRVGVLGARQRAIGNAVFVDVAVSSPRRHAVEILGGEHFAPIEGFLRIRQRRCEPRVHTEVEIAQHEDRRLKAIRQFERLHRELVRFLNRGGEEHDVLRVAVREVICERYVALHRAGRQAGRRARPLHVEDHAGNFGEITVAGVLGHERDARTRGRGHRPRAGPAGTKHHAGGGEFVFGLQDGELVLAGLFPDPVLFTILDEVFTEGRGRRDRIPGGDRAPSHDATQRCGPIAVHEERPVDLSDHAFEAVRIPLFAMLARVLEADAHGVHVQFDGGRLRAKLRLEAFLDRLGRNLEQMRERPDVDHVHQILAQVALIGESVFRELRKRNRVVRRARRAAFRRSPERPLRAARRRRA